MKTLTLTTLLTLLLVVVALPAAADLAFTVSGTVAGAEISTEGTACRLDLNVETVAGIQSVSVNGYDRAVCQQVERLEPGQRAEGRGALFVNDAGLPVPLLEWIEEH